MYGHDSMLEPYMDISMKININMLPFLVALNHTSDFDIFVFFLESSDEEFPIETILPSESEVMLLIKVKLLNLNWL